MIFNSFDNHFKKNCTQFRIRKQFAQLLFTFFEDAIKHRGNSLVCLYIRNRKQYLALWRTPCLPLAAV